MNKPNESEMVLAVADVAGFAKACHGKSDVDTFDMLDLFYRLVGKAVPPAGGTVVKFMGDCAFMVFPASAAEPAVAALRRMKTDAADLWAEFGATCRLRVHAHVGRAASGPIGPDQRFDVIGKSVNDLFSMPWDGPELSDALRRLTGG